MTLTKKEAAKNLADKGLGLPDNWSKMTTDRAIKWAEDALGALPARSKTVRLIAHGISAITGAVAGIASGLLDAGKSIAGVADDEPPMLDKAARKNAVRKVYSDPTYVRSTTATRRRTTAYRREVVAADPVPMTRQVARRKTLDAGQPASNFRRFMGA